MKKIGLLFIAMLTMVGMQAQTAKFAYVDTEYILTKIPDYEKAQDKLEKISDKWKNEIAAEKKNIDRLFDKFEREQYIMNEDTKKAKIQEIEEAERKLIELREQRFGYDGDLFKKEQELIKPIQDKVYNAIQKLAEERKLDFIFDRSSGGSYMLFANPTFNLSNEIIQRLGYSVD